MTDFFGYMSASEVVDGKTFANFVHQQLGTPFPSKVHLNTLNKRVRQFFTEYPDANWMTMVRLVEYCKSRKKRPAHAYAVFSQLRFAFAAGYLPELEPKEHTDEELEQSIQAALEVERDTKWRERLIASTGVNARRRVYVAWTEARHG
jgi:hypothetical protein